MDRRITTTTKPRIKSTKEAERSTGTAIYSKEERKIGQGRNRQNTK